MPRRCHRRRGGSPRRGRHFVGYGGRRGRSPSPRGRRRSGSHSGDRERRWHFGADIVWSGRGRGRGHHSPGRSGRHRSPGRHSPGRHSPGRHSPERHFPDHRFPGRDNPDCRPHGGRWPGHGLLEGWIFGRRPMWIFPNGPGRGPCRERPTVVRPTDPPKPEDPVKPIDPPISDKPKVPEEERPSTPDATEEEVQKNLHVTQTQLHAITNGKTHHTEMFEMVEDGRLVIRRGQSFDLTLTLNRPYDANQDKMRVVFEIGKNPSPGKGSLIRLLSTGAIQPNQWKIQVDHQEGNDLHLKVFVPAKCIIGKWNLYVETKEEGSAKWLRRAPEKVYILFNPWCKEDSTFMKDEKLLEEYVLNDSGCIYTGTAKQIGAKPWNFAQFEDGMLEAALYVVDKGFNWEYTQARGDPIRVSRTISQLVNSNDDEGVIYGNWSGNYGDGTPPTFWSGSFSILDEYMEKRKPVKYGQCWVYAGVTTTVCRAIGLPSRCVSNFQSAHDTDASVTIDTYYSSEDMQPINEMNEDSVWNFHVWNEAWMARPDLQNQYDGWQVIDATPQEASDGLLCCGPAPVAAVKAGDLSRSYDATFVFAEVNADMVHWLESEDGDFTVVQMEKDAIGKFISTKVPDGKPLEDHKAQRLDITNTYKHPEGLDKEREAVIRASLNVTTDRSAYDQESAGMMAEFIVKENQMIGEDFDISVRLTNKRRVNYTVDYLRVHCDAMFYIGAVAGEIKVVEFKAIQVNALETVTFKMDVTKDEYLPVIAELNGLRFRAIGMVKESQEYFLCEEDMLLNTPRLTLEMPVESAAQAPFTCKISLTNPLPVPLTNGILSLNGPGMAKTKIKKVSEIAAGDTWSTEIEMTPKRRGKKQVLASFDCDELPDVNGSGVIIVTPPEK